MYFDVLHQLSSGGSSNILWNVHFPVSSGSGSLFVALAVCGMFLCSFFHVIVVRFRYLHAIAHCLTGNLMIRFIVVARIGRRPLLFQRFRGDHLGLRDRLVFVICMVKDFRLVRRFLLCLFDEGGLYFTNFRRTGTLIDNCLVGPNGGQALFAGLFRVPRGASGGFLGGVFHVLVKRGGAPCIPVCQFLGAICRRSRPLFEVKDADLPSFVFICRLFF